MMSIQNVWNRACPNGQAESTGIKAEGLITKKELAQRLKKSTRTVENWEKLGLIPCVRVRRSVMYNWDKVLAQLEERYGAGQAGNN